jgi:deoxyribodipyrimidine photo-lyase
MPLDLQSRVGCVIGHDYPPPIVDHRKAYKLAQEKIYAIRRSESAMEESKRVFVKHGSRKKRDPLPRLKKPTEHRQLSLFDAIDDAN